MEHVSLADADLAGAILEGARLGGANLFRALLEDANMCGVHARFANFEEAVLERVDAKQGDFWGANFKNALLHGADLQGAKLNECCFDHANLAEADLRGAFLTHADMRSSDLSSTSLVGADLKGANLAGAILVNANLQNVVLTNTIIKHACLGGATLTGAQLRRDQLGDAIGDELKQDFKGARLGYLALERNFIERGDPDAASWAYLKRRRMQKHEAMQKARQSWKGTSRWHSVQYALQYAADTVAELLCDYGESLPRVLATFLVIYMVFAAGFDITGSVVRRAGAGAPVVTHNLIDVGLFSFGSLTSSTSSGLGPSNSLVQLFSGFEALLFAGLTGLFGFVLGNRIRR